MALVYLPWESGTRGKQLTKRDHGKRRVLVQRPVGSSLTAQAFLWQKLSCQKRMDHSKDSPEQGPNLLTTLFGQLSPEECGKKKRVL